MLENVFLHYNHYVIDHFTNYISFYLIEIYFV